MGNDEKDGVGEHNTTHSTFLRSLCRTKCVPRLKMLLGEKGLFDIVMLFTMALLNHLVRRLKDEPILSQLDPLVPRLRQLVEIDDDEVRDLISPDLVRLYAARSLIHLDFLSVGCNGDSVNEGSAFYRPTKVLDLVSAYSTSAQAHCRRELQEVTERNMMYEEELQNGRLLDELHVGHVRLDEFGDQLTSFENRRSHTFNEVKDCARVVETSEQVVEGCSRKHDLFRTSLDELSQAMMERNSQGLKLEEAYAFICEREQQHQDKIDILDGRRSERQAAEEKLQEATEEARIADQRLTELSREERHCLKYQEDAPGKLEIAQQDMTEVAQRLLLKIDAGNQFKTEMAVNEQQSTIVQQWDREGKAALKKLVGMRSEMTAFKNALSSETILTDEEEEQLRELESKLFPRRPTRYLNDMEGDWLSMDETSKNAPPVWDDDGAELEHQNTHNFRTFSRLCATREKLWRAERLWLDNLDGQLDDRKQRMVARQAEYSKEEVALLEEEERLRSQVEKLSDFNGHAERTASASAEVVKAQEEVRETATKETEASAEYHPTKARLDEASEDEQAASAMLDAARALANAGAEAMLRINAEIEMQMEELESKMRSLLQEWHGLEQTGSYLTVSLENASTGVSSEAAARNDLQCETQTLISDLQKLDQQLVTKGGVGTTEYQSQGWLSRSTPGAEQ